MEAKSSIRRTSGPHHAGQWWSYLNATSKKGRMHPLQLNSPPIPWKGWCGGHVKVLAQESQSQDPWWVVLRVSGAAMLSWFFCEVVVDLLKSLRISIQYSSSLSLLIPGKRVELPLGALLIYGRAGSLHSTLTMESLRLCWIALWKCSLSSITGAHCTILLLLSFVLS
jgi:hypothetical protein